MKCCQNEGEETEIIYKELDTSPTEVNGQNRFQWLYIDFNDGLLLMQNQLPLKWQILWHETGKMQLSINIYFYSAL